MSDTVRTGRRSRRLYVYWAIALFLLVSTAVLCWAVVVPVWRVRRVVTGLGADLPATGAIWEEAPVAIAQLGGPRQTAEQTGKYLGWPNWLAPEKAVAVRLLGCCGEDAVPELERLLDHDDSGIRADAVRGLIRVGAVTQVVDVRPETGHVAFGAGKHLGVREGLVYVIRHGDQYVGTVRVTAVWNSFCGGTVLESRKPIKAGDAAVLTFAADAVTRAVRHKDASVRQAAASALEKIKAVQEKK